MIKFLYLEFFYRVCTASPQIFHAKDGNLLFRLNWLPLKPAPTIVYFCVFAAGNAAVFWAGFRAHDERLVTAFILAMIFAMFFVAITTMILITRLRTRIGIEDGRVQEKPDPKLPLGNPASKGFRWNMYGCLLILTFGNPVAMLTVWAAKAHDLSVLLTILAVLAATFIISRRLITQKPEEVLNVWRAIMIAQFPLLLVILHLRWELWTGKSPWQVQGDAMLPIAVGFFLFAFTTLHWFFKRHR